MEEKSLHLNRRLTQTSIFGTNSIELYSNESSGTSIPKNKNIANKSFFQNYIHFISAKNENNIKEKLKKEEVFKEKPAKEDVVKEKPKKEDSVRVNDVNGTNGEPKVMTSKTGIEKNGDKERVFGDEHESQDSSINEKLIELRQMVEEKTQSSSFDEDSSLFMEKEKFFSDARRAEKQQVVNDDNNVSDKYLKFSLSDERCFKCTFDGCSFVSPCARGLKIHSSRNHKIKLNETLVETHFDEDKNASQKVINNNTSDENDADVMDAQKTNEKTNCFQCEAESCEYKTFSAKGMEIHEAKCNKMKQLIDPKSDQQNLLHTLENENESREAASGNDMVEDTVEDAVENTVEDMAEDDAKSDDSIGDNLSYETGDDESAFNTDDTAFNNDENAFDTDETIFDTDENTLNIDENPLDIDENALDGDEDKDDNNVKVYKCDHELCDFKSSHWRGLKIHEARYHKIIPPRVNENRPQDFLSMRSSEKSSLKKLTTSEPVVAANKQFKCTFVKCDFSSDTIKGLKIHTFHCHKVKLLQNENSFEFEDDEEETKSESKDESDSMDDNKAVDDLYDYNEFDDFSSPADGNIFKCTFSGCDFSSPHFKGIKIHSARYHKHLGDLSDAQGSQYIHETEKMQQSYDDKEQGVKRNADEDLQQNTFACSLPQCDFRSNSEKGLKIHTYRYHGIKLLTGDIMALPLPDDKQDSVGSSSDQQELVIDESIDTDDDNVPKPKSPQETNDGLQCYKCHHSACRFTSLTLKGLRIHSARYHGLSLDEQIAYYDIKGTKKARNSSEKNPFEMIGVESPGGLKMPQTKPHLNHYSKHKILTLQQTEEESLNVPFKCQFPFCQFVGTNGETLKTHVAQVHKPFLSSNEQNSSQINYNPLKCKFDGCNVTADSNVELDLHFSITHGHLFNNSNNMQMPKSSKSGDSNEDDPNNVTNYSKEDGKKLHKIRLPSSVSELHFKSKVQMPQKIRSRPKPYACLEVNCSNTFSTPEELQQHKQQDPHHIKNSINCSSGKCSSTFENYTHLRDDIKEKQMIQHKYELKYKCDWPNCNASFRLATQLLNHKHFHGDAA